MTELSQQQEEKRALKLSVVGAFVMAVSGIGFFFAAKSEAILLDGVFSGIGFVLSVLTLKVSQIVLRPDDEHFHFGYAHFGPWLNVLKALLMLILCVFAVISAIDALLSGGREMQAGIAVIYGAVATTACATLALIFRRVAKNTKSALVAVDAESWYIDTLMSAAVLIAFVIGYSMQDSAYSDYVRYVDPVLVLVIVAVALPVPVRILVSSFSDLLGYAPDKELLEQLDRLFLQAVNNVDVADYRIRVLQLGSTINVLIHLRPGPAFELAGFNSLDATRDRIQQQFAEVDRNVVLDVVFVGDMRFSV